MPNVHRYNGSSVPGSSGLALHLLTVPDLDGPIVGAGGKDGVLVGDADAVHSRLVLVQVSHQQPFGVPACGPDSNVNSAPQQHQQDLPVHKRTFQKS